MECPWNSVGPPELVHHFFSIQVQVELGVPETLDSEGRLINFADHVVVVLRWPHRPVIVGPGCALDDLGAIHEQWPPKK